MEAGLFAYSYEFVEGKRNKLGTCTLFPVGVSGGVWCGGTVPGLVSYAWYHLP